MTDKALTDEEKVLDAFTRLGGDNPFIDVGEGFTVHIDPSSTHIIGPPVHCGPSIKLVGEGLAFIEGVTITTKANGDAIRVLQKPKPQGRKGLARWKRERRNAILVLSEGGRDRGPIDIDTIAGDVDAKLHISHLSQGEFFGTIVTDA